MKILNKIFNNGGAKGKSFFDYSSKEKKKIVKEAARESNREQLELVKRYCKNYNFK
jgi:TRAP-type C4-dicarboxylate transport system substrate-binding protein